MKKEALKGLNQFLDDYLLMSRVPYLKAGVCLRGEFLLKANIRGCEEIQDSYMLEIIVPDGFPQHLPIVIEFGGKIPRDGNFHINHDGSLCLGSPLRLLETMYDTPDLVAFIDKILVPYLYAISHKLKYGKEFVFGELSHGVQGLVEDYSSIFGLQGKNQIKHALKLLGLKKRIANKRLCPCGCKKKLGTCRFHHKLNKYRKMAPVSWFKENHILND